MSDKSNQLSEVGTELSADMLTRICGGASAYQVQVRRDPMTAMDDVVVDGRIITAENYDS